MNTARRAGAGQGEAGLGSAGLTWLGVAGLGSAGRGCARHGSAGKGQARRGVARPRESWRGTFRRGSRGMASHGVAGLGKACQGGAGRGSRGTARHGEAGLGKACQGGARQSRHGQARRGMARRGSRGTARLGQGATQLVIVGHGTARSGRHARKKDVAAAIQALRQRSRKSQRIPTRKATPKMANNADVARIDPIDAETLLVPIIGTAPLIVNNFSDKSRRQMLEAQQGKKRVKTIRDPHAEYQAAFYRIYVAPTGRGAAAKSQEHYGFPVTAFKAATVGAARFYDKSVRMTDLRQFMFFRGIVTKADALPLVEIAGTPEMREDVVRLGGPSRSADLRYRPMFPEWSCTLPVTYVKSSIDRDSVLSLIDAGGMGIGVGEWRPERRGEFGTYRIDPTRKIQVEK